MAYAFDPELVSFVEMLPNNDLTDLESARANIVTLVEPFNAGVDTTGVAITDHEVPGPESGPPVAVRVYVPDVADRAARDRRCSTSTAAGSSSATWPWSTPSRRRWRRSSAPSW